MKHVALLGATGSIGQAALSVMSAQPERFHLSAMAAGSDAAGLRACLNRVHEAQYPAFVAVADVARYAALKTAFAGLPQIELAAGAEAICEAAVRSCDLVIAGISGIAGLQPALAALEAGHDLALANKESMVAAGALMKETAARSGARILPLDSEHNAIFQVFEEANRAQIYRLILTASGGPFLNRPRADLQAVTPQEAVAHPNWNMGAKISTDSATLMNKGLELIEAAYLFDIPSEQIEIVIHPQSVVHSLVEYRDGSTLAQLGSPDMRVPMASCLAWPERLELDLPRLDLPKLARLDFAAPNLAQFPALDLCRQALEAGGMMPVVLNAANEVAVAAFLAGECGFLQITDCVAAICAQEHDVKEGDLPAILATDAIARRQARQWLETGKISALQA